MRASGAVKVVLRAAAALLMVLTADVATAAKVGGLIVQLRDAPTHEALARESALAQSAESSVVLQRRRWQRILTAAGLADRAVGGAPNTLRPAGRAAQVVGFTPALTTDQADRILTRLRALPEVEWAVANERESRLQNTTPSDPMFSGTMGQWWLQLAGGSDANALEARLRGVPGMQRAWLQTNGLPAAPVAVLDTGSTAHQELQGHLLPGYDLVSDLDIANDGDGRDDDASDPGDWINAADRANAAFDGCELADSSWHGTVIAGLIAARTDNSAGVAAINWRGRIVPVRVAGKCGAQVADIVDGLRWAAGLAVSDGRGGLLPRNANPARVVNVSFGGNAPCHAAYQSAIDELRDLGVVVVAAAGNLHGAVVRPASCRGVVAVTALNRDGFKTHYSSFGPQVKLATVGGDDPGGAWGSLLADQGLLSIANRGRAQPGASGYARHAGTSFAAPLVAGTLSLMLSVNPTLGLDHLIAGLTVTARPHVRSPWIAECSFANPGRCLCTTATCGAGILDAEQALLYAADPAAYAVPARGPEVLDNAELRDAAALGPDRPGQAAAVPEPSSGGGALDLKALLGLVVALGALSRARRAAPKSR